MTKNDDEDLDELWEGVFDSVFSGDYFLHMHGLVELHCVHDHWHPSFRLTRGTWLDEYAAHECDGCCWLTPEDFSKAEEEAARRMKACGVG